MSSFKVLTASELAKLSPAKRSEYLKAVRSLTQEVSKAEEIAYKDYVKGELLLDKCVITSNDKESIAKGKTPKLGLAFKDRRFGIYLDHVQFSQIVKHADKISEMFQENGIAITLADVPKKAS